MNATQQAKTPAASAKHTTPASPMRSPANVTKSSRHITDDEIRVLAYHKWVSAGRPDGDGMHFWLEAERELQM